MSERLSFTIPCNLVPLLMACIPWHCYMIGCDMHHQHLELLEWGVIFSHHHHVQNLLQVWWWRCWYTFLIPQIYTYTINFYLLGWNRHFGNANLNLKMPSTGLSQHRYTKWKKMITMIRFIVCLTDGRSASTLVIILSMGQITYIVTHYFYWFIVSVACSGHIQKTSEMHLIYTAYQKTVRFKCYGMW
jgi:hypothetical protein